MTFILIFLIVKLIIFMSMDMLLIIERKNKSEPTVMFYVIVIFPIRIIGIEALT